MRYDCQLMKVTIPTLTIIICSSLLFAGSAKGIGSGQVDDFEDGTTQFWDNGGAGAPPVVNVDTGGPGGVNDNFMQITSIGGGGPGRFLVGFNQTQWIGNYISAGVIAIEGNEKSPGAAAADGCNLHEVVARAAWAASIDVLDRRSATTVAPELGGSVFKVIILSNNDSLG